MKKIILTLAIVSLIGSQVCGDGSSDLQKRVSEIAGQVWQRVESQWDKSKMPERVQSAKEAYSSLKDNFIGEKKVGVKSFYEELKLASDKQEQNGIKQHWETVVERWNGEGFGGALWQTLVAMTAFVKSYTH